VYKKLLTIDRQNRHTKIFLLNSFLGDVCKTVRPMLSDRCPVCPFLSVCNVGVLWPNGWMDQDATALGTEVNLGPGDVVLDGVPVPPKSAQPSSFRPMSIVATAALQLLLSSCLLWRCSSSGRVPQKITFPDNTGAVDFYRRILFTSPINQQRQTAGKVDKAQPK